MFGRFRRGRDPGEPFDFDAALANTPAQVVGRHAESTLDDAIDLLVKDGWRIIFDMDTSGRIACIATKNGYVASVVGDRSEQCKRALIDTFFEEHEGK